MVSTRQKIFGMIAVFSAAAVIFVSRYKPEYHPHSNDVPERLQSAIAFPDKYTDAIMYMDPQEPGVIVDNSFLEPGEVGIKFDFNKNKVTQKMGLTCDQVTIPFAALDAKNEIANNRGCTQRAIEVIRHNEYLYPGFVAQSAVTFLGKVEKDYRLRPGDKRAKEKYIAYLQRATR